MNRIFFYLLNTALVFASFVIVPAIVELIVLIVNSARRYVDDRKGKIVGFCWEKEWDGENSYVDKACYTVECFINGQFIRRKASRITTHFYLFKKLVKADLGKEVAVKYHYKRNGDVSLSIYELARSMRRILLAAAVSALGVLGLIVLWKNSF